MRIASYNLRDLKDDRAALTRVVRSIDPDVILLQECPRSWWGARRTRAWIAGTGLHLPQAPRGAGGTTLALRRGWSAQQARHVRLPVPRFARPRGYAAATVTSPDGAQLTVASVHLSLHPQERAEHAGQILRALDGLTPCVIAGDLNEGADGSAWGLFAGSLDDLGALAGRRGPTFPSREPRHRLDVLWGRGVAVLSGRQQPAFEPDDLQRATDHLPVWVDVEVSIAPGAGDAEASGIRP